LGLRQRQYSRKVSSNAALSGRSRLRPPLPRSTRIIMRWLSMSPTFKRTSSERRIPVE
jgi:hypothetical protein